MKRFGLLGRKKGMTQVFDAAGNIVPVTVLEMGPCTVVQKKTKEPDGYEAIQIGFEEVKPERCSKPQRGHFAKQQSKAFRHLKEFRIAEGAPFTPGQQITVRLFQPGDRVHVSGVTKGRGFQGVIKKEGKHGGPDAHGSDFHRRPGSIGMRTWPGRVLKNMGMPGRYGSDRMLTKNLMVAEVRPEQNLVLLKGAVPGARESLVVVYTTARDFEKRLAV